MRTGFVKRELVNPHTKRGHVAFGDKIDEVSPRYGVGVNIMLHVPKEKLSSVLKSLPNLKSHAVRKIAGENWYNVLTFCGKIDSRRLIPKLKGLGCESLVEFPGVKLTP